MAAWHDCLVFEADISMGERGKVFTEKLITREMVRAGNPNTIFVFGDNMEGRGRGGQAASMRGEPNAVGVPTKWYPSMSEDAFFNDDDIRNRNVHHLIMLAFYTLDDHLKAGRNVVLPANGLGTGLARLAERAPKLQAWIDSLIESLKSRNSA